VQRLVLISLILMNVAFPAQTIKAKDPLLIMGQLLNVADMEMEEWEVVLKDSLTEEQTKIILENHATYEHENHEQAIIYTLNNFYHIGSISVDLRIIKPKNNPRDIELIATIYGQKYNEHTEQNYVTIKNLLEKQYFSPSVQKYTCIKLNSDVIINENDYFSKIIKMFNIKDAIIHKDHLKQHTDYEILYGHTDLWEETIRVNDHSMNIHLVKRSYNKQETAFFIGTPILLNEY